MENALRRPRHVLVTAAGGQTGRAVMRAVQDADGIPRAFVRDRRRVARVNGLETAVGDQRNSDDLARALEGVDAVYLIAPNVSPNEVDMGRAMLSACARAGVERLVYHSVAHPQISAMPHHTDKLRVEELVIESGLAWTILQPNTYLQNLHGYADQLHGGAYCVPYDVDQPFAMVDLRDVAEVGARCVLDGLGIHATYELSGEEVTAREVARTASQLLNIDVEVARKAPETWARENAHLAEVPLRRLQAMWTHYDRHGLTGESTVLAHLLDRHPRDLAGYLGELLLGSWAQAGAVTRHPATS